MVEQGIELVMTFMVDFCSLSILSTAPESSNRYSDLLCLFQVDRQLACCRIQSNPGQRYLKAMKCAANFAFVNRFGLSKTNLL